MATTRSLEHDTENGFLLETWPDGLIRITIADGETLTDVYLWAVLVSYRGGPLHLHNVLFGQTRFDLPDENNANVRKFIDALLSADRNVVSIDLH
jgi:hypothetical protein